MERITGKMTRDKILAVLAFVACIAVCIGTAWYSVGESSSSCFSDLPQAVAHSCGMDH